MVVAQSKRAVHSPRKIGHHPRQIWPLTDESFDRHQMALKIVKKTMIAPLTEPDGLYHSISCSLVYLD